MSGMGFWKLLFLILWMAVRCAGVSAESLYVHFLDVGQADAAILQCGDAVMMIDGGDSADSSLIYSYLTKTLNVQHIDYMIASHPHADHIGGLSGALNACTVGQIFSPVSAYDSRQFISLQKYAQKQHIGLTVPKAGESFALGDAQVQFLSPARSYDEINNSSIVVRIVHGENAFLFTGDAQREAEQDMIASGYELASDVLKVGHHGSDTSSSALFLSGVAPDYAVISCGADNAYGHPDDEVLGRLEDAGAQVFRTDLQGSILCISDGSSLTFYTERTAGPETTRRGTDGKAAEEDAQESCGASVESARYVGNRNSRKFHDPSCSSVSSMAEKNKAEFSSREEAIGQGYTPCNRCSP